jgi:hypothetical protein
MRVFALVLVLATVLGACAQPRTVEQNQAYQAKRQASEIRGYCHALARTQVAQYAANSDGAGFYQGLLEGQMEVRLYRGCMYQHGLSP